MTTQKVKLMSNKPFDELYTPNEATECLLSFIPKSVKTIWEPTAIPNSTIVKVLRDNGYKVITSHIDKGQDFLKYIPEEQFDMIITNPPFSLKDKFLKRAFEIDKPFFFLLPLTTLEGQKRNKLFSNRKIEMVIPNKRFNFIKGKKGSWFQTSWFGYKIGLENQLNFIDLTNDETE
jgi:hypothetical protein